MCYDPLRLCLCFLICFITCLWRIFRYQKIFDLWPLAFGLWPLAFGLDDFLLLALADLSISRRRKFLLGYCARLLIFICFWRVFCLRLWFWTLFAFAYAFGCLRALASLTAGLWFRALASGLLTLAFSGLWPLISCSSALAFSCLWPLVSCSGLGPLGRALVLWPSLAFGFVLWPLAFMLLPLPLWRIFRCKYIFDLYQKSIDRFVLKSFGRSPLVKNQRLRWHFQRFAFKIFQKS